MATAVLVVSVQFAAMLAWHLQAAPAIPEGRSTEVPRNPFTGLGTWVDMYAWSDTFTGGHPRFAPADIDTMAAVGVQTLFIQAASQTGPPAVLEPVRLRGLLDRAHRRGLAVVVWYLPSLADPASDLARLRAVAALPAEGVGVDIESKDVADAGQRNAALTTFSQQLRSIVGPRPLGAIVLPPSLLEVVNPGFWPGFPWRAIARFYDAWLPMAYWTGRLQDSGFRDGYAYTVDSVRRLRANLGLVAPRIHPIGGNAIDGIGLGQVDRFVAGVQASGTSGGSLYEWTATDPAAWSHLKALRS